MVYVSYFTCAMTSMSGTIIMSSPQQPMFNVQTMRLLFLRPCEKVPKQKQYMKKDKRGCLCSHYLRKIHRGPTRGVGTQRARFIPGKVNLPPCGGSIKPVG